MASNLTPQQMIGITTALSPTRLGTYVVAPGFSATADAFEKYQWNALVSGAFFSSIHICEVAVRNGVASVLEVLYGPAWPWNVTYENSLPTPGGKNFNPRSELKRARAKMAVGATGKVIAELKFAFWCHMFTSRYQGRLWQPHIHNAFPHIPNGLTSDQARKTIWTDLDNLRVFRNRIAHHEPILAAPLAMHHQQLTQLIDWRSSDLSNWLSTWELITQTAAAKP
jgi:hypothetical protein